MTAVSIRPATPADIPAITRIYAHAVQHGTASFELEPPDEAEMTRRRKALLDGGFPYLVATSDGAVVGYAYAGPYRTRPAYRFSVEISVYVAVDAHRRGVGRALMDRLIAESEARGYRLMIAVIGDPACRRVRGRRLQVRPLAGHRPDAACARQRHVGAAVEIRSSRTEPWRELTPPPA